MSDKLKNESGQFFFTEQRKRQKIVKTDHFFLTFWMFTMLRIASKMGQKGQKMAKQGQKMAQRGQK